MSVNKLFLKTVIALILGVCFCSFVGCNHANNVITDSVQQDTISDRVSFGKKYFSLGYNGVISTEYYTFNQNGSASYTHIMKEGNDVTFHQIINFKWTYAGDGNCILMHNGTQIVKGTQDDAFGLSRVMHVAKDVVYWSASGENTYFICEDFVSQIPNYAKLITN